MKLSETDNFIENLTGIDDFNKPCTIHVKEQFYVFQQKTSEGTLQTKPVWRCWEVIEGAGHTPSYVFTNGHEPLTLGDNQLYLYPIDERERISSLPLDRIKKICRRWDLITKDCELWELHDKILQVHDSDTKFYDVTQGVDSAELEHLKNIDETLRLCLTDGMTKDETLLYAAKMHILQNNFEAADPSMMRYAPHAIIITNPKCGKTWTYQRIGNVIERATAANLLGFATSDEVCRGTLDGQTACFALDEVQEEKDMELWGKLLGLMEVGETHVARGRGIICKSLSPLVFLGNPRRITGNVITGFDLVNMFSDVLGIVTGNAKALGSRIGLVLFGNEFKAAEGKPMSRERIDKLRALLEAIQIDTGVAFSELQKKPEVEDWCNDKFPDEYFKTCDKFAKKAEAQGLTNIRDFFLGHKEAYRHVRGGAVRLAALDWLGKLLRNENIPTDEFLGTAETHFHKIMSLNIKAFNDILNASEGFSEGYQENRIQNMRPEYLRLFFLSVRECSKEHPEQLLPLEMVAPYFEKVREEQKIDVNHMYGNWSHITQLVWKNKAENAYKLKEWNFSLIDAPTKGVAILKTTSDEQNEQKDSLQALETPKSLFSLVANGKGSKCDDVSVTKKCQTEIFLSGEIDNSDNSENSEKERERDPERQTTQKTQNPSVANSSLTSLLLNFLNMHRDPNGVPLHVLSDALNIDIDTLTAELQQLNSKGEVMPVGPGGQKWKLL